MWNFLTTRGVDLAVATMGLTVLTTGPAWAGEVAPGPGAGLLVGGAIVCTLVIAKLWRRK